MSGIQADPQHQRLIDHFKRVYAIVAGLALAEACRRTLPLSGRDDPRLWMFLAFFATIIPIFHGGDRSLDEKYFAREPVTPIERFWFVWDDYMLLITAVLFVCMAESIPSQDAIGPLPRPGFYVWFRDMLGFDVLVLILDLIKTTDLKKLGPYPIWIMINCLMFCVCSAAARIAASRTDGDTSLSTMAELVFVAACVRTGFDYAAGAGFLFPGTRQP